MLECVYSGNEPCPEELWAADRSGNLAVDSFRADYGVSRERLANLHSESALR